jgi:ArsR family transcriptional regulator, lead/cadmium/zinc/bismuth-responsive transcriptional repressor
MGTSKTKLFTERQNRLAALAKALAHPARVAILEYLVQKGACVCGDIVEELPLSQSTISQHLKAMKDAGIIKGSIEGIHTCYCLNGQRCLELKAAFGKLLDGIQRCC